MLLFSEKYEELIIKPTFDYEHDFNLYIYVNKFFPSDQARLKRLLKIILDFCGTELTHDEHALDQVCLYLQYPENRPLLTGGDVRKGKMLDKNIALIKQFNGLYSESRCANNGT